MAVMLTDIRELKSVLEIDQNNTAEDVKLGFMIEWASTLIEDFLDRKLGLTTRTEYHDGTDTPCLRLNCRPVLVAGLQVYIKNAAYYGSVPDSFSSDDLQTYGDSYALDIDQPDGTSRSGILVRINGVWPRITARQRGLLSPFRMPNFGSIKVTYDAGYTVDSMPAPIRMACNLLVMKMRNLMPLGMEMGSESYEERHISYAVRNKDYLLSLVKPILFQYRNWSF